MFTRARPFFLLVETPLHVGSGTDLGVVDLPIQRERHTGLPKIEASGVKGSIREAFEQLTGDDARRGKLEETFPNLKGDQNRYRQAVNLVFGPEEGDLYAGALGFTDARLLLFPVRSARGIFAWVTCPAVLNRLRRELEVAGVVADDFPLVPEAATVPEQSDLLVQRADGEREESRQGGGSSGRGTVVLEEYTFEVQKDRTAGKLAEWLADKAMPQQPILSWWREKIKRSLVILTDDDFRDFTTMATEVVTRIRIDADTGTVKSGHLFTEEYLPQESLLYCLALASPLSGGKEDKEIYEAVLGEKERDKAVLRFWQIGMPEVLQVGGNATLGRGLVRIRVWGD